jgi:hypothetical protein
MTVSWRRLIQELGLDEEAANLRAGLDTLSLITRPWNGIMKWGEQHTHGDHRF